MKTLIHNDNSFIEQVISNCNICFVGMIENNGFPYVVPMNFGYRDNVFYFHSAPDGKLISALQNNPNICISMSTDNTLVWQHPEVACSYRMRSKSIIANGKVEFIDDFDKKLEALNIIMDHYVPNKEFKYGKPAVENVKIWQVTIDNIQCKEFGAPHK